MAVTQYKDIWWGATEAVDTDKLNTMVNNSRYLFERAPKLYYMAYGQKKDTGIRMACGVATVAPRKANLTWVTVQFGTFFNTACKPVIAVSLTAGSRARIIPTLFGISGVNYQPDNRGFVCRLAATELSTKINYFDKTMYLNWIAMGF